MSVTKEGKKQVPLGGIGPSAPCAPDPTMLTKMARQMFALSDNWDKLETRTFNCVTCMHYLNFRCRRHAPNGQEGWPAVYPTDYCGDHKMDKRTMAERA